MKYSKQMDAMQNMGIGKELGNSIFPRKTGHTKSFSALETDDKQT
jgi:hypothetical protein